ncbi:MAG: 4Fe-4S binding protein [Dehalococcoidia bacterium]|jgi:2-oxoglutarate ferredoxin oxidoreductase subunit delta|nr:4Fe-4S binding protein [Dehalococcoidia bacterium]
MPRGEIVIFDEHCKGCGYCAEFCSRDCIEHPGGRYSSQGYMLPNFVAPEKCNACGICAWMCPDHAIDVYKLVEEGATA